MIFPARKQALRPKKPERCGHSQNNWTKTTAKRTYTNASTLPGETPPDKKEHPLGIAVFKNEKKIESERFIVVECKKKNHKDRRMRLENYLTLSNEYLGV